MSLAERYLELGLRLGRHVDGLVDAYYGPPGLAERVSREPAHEPAVLAELAAALGAELGAADGRLAPERARWLRAQVAGLECVARTLAGESIGYADEVERCYGIRPAMASEETFAAAHRTLDDALPGSGSLAERYDAWQEAHTIPPTSCRRRSRRSRPTSGPGRRACSACPPART